jgi:hypothetical protein
MGGNASLELRAGLCTELDRSRYSQPYSEQS